MDYGPLWRRVRDAILNNDEEELAKLRRQYGTEEKLRAALMADHEEGSDDGSS